MIIEAEKIDISKVLIARKRTDIEYAMSKKHIDEATAVKRALRKGEDGERQVSAHFRFKENLRRFLSYFREDQLVVVGEELTRELVRPASLLIAFGGDDYFKYASHFIENGLFAGVNGEPLTSNGVLTSFDSESFEGFLPNFESGRFYIEEWTRLIASINGHILSDQAISEVFLGSPWRKRSSKYALEFGDLKGRLSNSGLLVATGTGSTGWYHAAASCEHEEAETFPRTSPEARFYTTEAFFGRLNAHFPRRGSINFGENLTILGTSHFPAILSVDSVNDYPFKRGMTVKIGISDMPLKVIGAIT